MRNKIISIFGIILVFFMSVITTIDYSVLVKGNTQSNETTLGIEFVSSGFNVDYKFSELFGVSAVIRNTGSDVCNRCSVEHFFLRRIYRYR